MFSVFNRQYYFGQICSKNQNCQIKLKFVILTISNIQNLIVIFITLFLFFICTFYLKNLFSVVNGGEEEWGFGFKMEGWKIFKVSLHIYCLYPLPFLKNLSNLSLLCHFQPSLPLFVFVLPYFFDWVSDHATFNVLFYLTMIWIYTCRALVP